MFIQKQIIYKYVVSNFIKRPFCFRKNGLFNLITDSKSNYPCNKSLTTVIKLALNEMNDSH